MSFESGRALDSSLIFPTAFGNEEESGVMENIYGSYNEPYEFVETRRFIIPASLQTSSDFLTNGFRIYDGGSGENIDGPTNIERATPECISPRQLVARIRTSEQILIDMAKRFAMLRSQGDEKNISLRIQRRVVDSEGSRKGCHDNYGMPVGSLLEYYPAQLHRPINMFLASRSFIVGAGHIEKSSLYYSQKINGLSAVAGYGFFGSMYRDRLITDEGSPRFEVRCSDINISDWASWIRIGGMALMFGILNTPLKDCVKELNELETIGFAKQANIFYLNKEGHLDLYKDQIKAIDFQQSIAELSLDKLQLYVDEIPEEYFKIASEILKYCEDFKKVASGYETIEILADRADWAAKLNVVMKSIDRDESFGIKRSLYDIKSQAQDLKYDYLGISATDGALNPVIKGIGYKLRERKNLRNILSENEIAEGYRNAPTETRAHIRSSLLREYNVGYVDWNEVQIIDSDGTHLIKLSDVLQTKLPSEDRIILECFKKRQNKK